MQGWISLHRKFQDNPLWKESRTFSKAEAWIDILMEVRHDEKQDKIMIKNTLITCGRGQSIKSIQTWAERWNWSVSAVRRFMHFLKREGMVTIENLRKTTRLTVCNYSTYQQRRISSESQVNLKRISLESQLNTDNNVNNENNDNNSASYTLQDVRDAGCLIGFRDPENKAFFNHYNAQGWLLGNGLPIADLTSAMTKWRNNGYKFPDQPKPPEDKTEQQHKQWYAQCGVWLKNATKEDLIAHGRIMQRLKEPSFRIWAEEQNVIVKEIA